MKKALVTGSGGLVGEACVRRLLRDGYRVTGVDNNTRQDLFGESASNQKTIKSLIDQSSYKHYNVDIRDKDKLDEIFDNYELIIHAAAQPSHDWAASNPIKDFTINANGTLNLLECFRQFCPQATFVYVSTNKVYGDTPNDIDVVEYETRYEPSVPSFVNESMSIDQNMHSLFGVSKTAGDLLTQEYGRYFNLNTVCFRCGCITGKAHSGVKLHGFLSYLVKSAQEGTPYEIIGYKGKQVRDNIHADDLVDAFLQFHLAPRVAQVYNIGGGRYNNCSVLEAISMCENLLDLKMEVSYSDEPRKGDHRWYVSDLFKFESHYPEWKITKSMEDIFNEYLSVYY